MNSFGVGVCFFSCWTSVSNTHKVGLVMAYSLSFCTFWKVLISSHTGKIVWQDRVLVADNLYPWVNISFYSILSSSNCSKKSGDSLVVLNLYVKFFFSLIVCKIILSLSLFLDSVTMMCHSIGHSELQALSILSDSSLLVYIYTHIYYHFSGVEGFPV